MLPSSLLLNVVRHQLVFDGVSLRVDVALSPDVVVHLVKSELQTYVNQQRNPPTAIGYNYVVDEHDRKCGIFAICLPNNYCLVAKADPEKPNSMLLEQFLRNSTENCCFVKAPRVPLPSYSSYLGNAGYPAGLFVARFRKEPSVYRCSDLGIVAQQVGEAYDESISPEKFEITDRGRYWDDLVFTENEIRDLVYRAYICCKIGQKVITELQAVVKSETSTVEDEIRDLVYRLYIWCKIGQRLIRELQVKAKSEASTAGLRTSAFADFL